MVQAHHDDTDNALLHPGNLAIEQSCSILRVSGSGIESWVARVRDGDSVPVNEQVLRCAGGPADHTKLRHATFWRSNHVKQLQRVHVGIDHARRQRLPPHDRPHQLILASMRYARPTQCPRLSDPTADAIVILKLLQWQSVWRRQFRPDARKLDRNRPLKPFNPPHR